MVAHYTAIAVYRAYLNNLLYKKETRIIDLGGGIELIIVWGTKVPTRKMPIAVVMIGSFALVFFCF